MMNTTRGISGGVGIALSMALLIGCASTTPPPPEDPVIPAESPADPATPVEGISHIQSRLLEGAAWAEGRDDLTVNGRRFNLDCTGVVLAIYWYAGINLQAAFPRYTGNGVTRLYRYMGDLDALYRPDLPVPGDIVFWDNSYDKNGNGRVDDDLTHCGMVVSTGSDGEVVYIHHNYVQGIVTERMNPADPGNPEKNSGMRMKSLGPTPEGEWSAGHLYKESGRGYEAPEGE